MDLHGIQAYDDTFMDDILPFKPHLSVVESDSDSDTESELDEDEKIRAEDSEGEDPDEEPDIFDWDSFKAPTDGLSEWDKLGEEYEAEAALGVYSLLIHVETG